ncbi:hypothetical protein ILUMI_04681 [Ignelater luminosus]|uniref:Regulatory protein zeste n=1 Tax=Ignelater luminosus TaxID=2038154 RepID=A0A8K0GKW6_IGNLU|nr:hypothetical protein ILUMI_04681 [Ignelater luminosus]
MESAKITILTRIRENKEMLFGKFSKKLTKEDKDKQWEEIIDEAKSSGVIGGAKSCTYLHNTTWQNWRKRALAKRDNRKKTGRGSGDDTHVTEMDTIVCDIIGKGSPVLDGFPIPESSGVVVPVVSNKPIDDVRGEKESISSVSNSNLTRTVGSKGVKRFRLRETNNEEQQLKIQKLKEQSTAPTLENHKRHLGIIELKNRLSLPPSQLIKEFLAKNYNI